MSIKTQPISLTINEKQYGPIEVPEGLMMIDFLHEYLDLTGSRLGCGQGYLPRLRGDRRSPERH